MTPPRLAILACALSVLGAPALAQDVNVYTYREPGLIKPLLDAFTADTGIKVNTVFAADGLAERIATEGANSPADVLLTVDIANLTEIVDQGITQPVKSDGARCRHSGHLRDPDGNWFGLSVRGRVIYASKDRVKKDQLTYEDLADPKWKGKVCIRSGQHPYNIALIAAMIAKDGEAKAEAWLEGVKANLARKPAGGDRDVARDILAGICDIGLGNSYYVGLMRSGTAGAEEMGRGDQA